MFLMMSLRGMYVNANNTKCFLFIICNENYYFKSHDTNIVYTVINAGERYKCESTM